MNARGIASSFKRAAAAAVALVVTVGGLVVVSGQPAHATVTGRTPFLVVMCKFAGQPQEPFTTTDVSRFFSEAGKGQGGMFDFFHDLSYGAIDLTGTTVKGWYPMPFTVDDEHRWEHGGQVTAGSTTIALTAGSFRSSDVGKSVYVMDTPAATGNRVFTSSIVSVDSATQATMAGPAPSSVSGVFIGLDKGRGQYIQDCVDTATSQDPGIDPTGYYGILAVVNAGAFDGGAVGVGQIPRTVAGNSGKWGWALFDADGLYVSFVGHEMGHTLGLQHSWSDQPWTDPKSGTVNPYTEYGDPYDLMSCFTSCRYFNGGMALNGVPPAAGPGLDAPYLDQAGWMPSFRQYFWSPGTTIDVPLLALSHPSGIGYYEVVIPMADKAGYPTHYLSVEYRYPDGWDKGIGSPAVVIHEVLPDGRSILLTHPNGGPWPADSVFHDPADNVAVGIGAFDSTYYKQAWIEVSPDYPASQSRPLPAPPTPPTGCAATVAYPKLLATMTCDGIGTYDAFDLKSEQAGYGTVSTDATVPHTVRPTMADYYTNNHDGVYWPKVNYIVCRRNPLGSACTDAITVVFGSPGLGAPSGQGQIVRNCPGPPSAGACKPPIFLQ